MVSTHPLTSLSTAVPHQSSGPITPCGFASRVALQLWGAERVNSSLPLVSDIPHNCRLALEDPALRRRAHGNLNKGETRHSLARAVFLHQLGELRDRVAETMAYRACGLNLVVNAIILWNTVYSI